MEVLYLVTGGLGYLGGHLVNQLLKMNHKVIILDDGSGHNNISTQRAVLIIKGSVTELDSFERVSEIGTVDGVFHVAAKKSISESVKNPELYFQVNKNGTENVVKFCKENDIKNIVFTSSAAVYGELDSTLPIEECSFTKPINPYGESKLEAEEILKFEANCRILSAISLRCFNIVGASEPYLLDKRGDNVLPRLIRSLLQSKTFVVHGGVHNTSDGTCVRDYVNISDVVLAHILAMKYLEQSPVGFYAAVNIGTGEGTSVLELIDSIEMQSNLILDWIYGEGKKGDPAKLVSSYKLAYELLGWVPTISLNHSVKETLISFKNFSL